MEWSWIDNRTSTIDIPGDATKTKRSRSVPINADMRGVLARAHACKVDGLPVFHRNGKPIVRITLHDHFVKARKAARLDSARFHDLRHTAASWMVQAGHDLYTVATILGHRSISMTQRYAKFANEHLKDAMEATSLSLHESGRALVV